MTGEEWVARHGGTIGGTPADEVAARVRADGLRVRVVRPGEVVTLEYRPDRVDLQCDASGRVVAARAG